MLLIFVIKNTSVSSIAYTNVDFHIKSIDHMDIFMRRSLIYMFFFYGLLRGKPVSTIPKSIWMESYLNEKKTLRIIAALKQKYGSNLTEQKLKEDLEILSLPAGILDNINVILHIFIYTRKQQVK
jgi:hypothetical protein